MIEEVLMAIRQVHAEDDSFPDSFLSIKKETSAKESIEDAMNKLLDDEEVAEDSIEDVVEDTIEPDIKAEIEEAATTDMYAQHTDMYKRFHKEMMKSIYQQVQTAEYTEEEKADAFSWGDDVISYKERKEIVRKIQMNALLGAGHNHIDPQEKDRYEFWKYASKFNLTMSFLMNANPFST